MVLGSVRYFFSRVIQKGPDLEKALLGIGKHDEDIATAGKELVRPTFEKPNFDRFV